MNLLPLALYHEGKLMSTPKPLPEAPVTGTGIQYSRDEDFLYRYANNVFFETTSWDLKITFGQTETQISPQAVIQHTAITLPWPYVKVFAYMLQIHLAGREAEDGKIMVPKGIVLPIPDELPKEAEGKLKHPKEGLEAVQRLYKEFIAANPEAAPQNK